LTHCMCLCLYAALCASRVCYLGASRFPRPGGRVRRQDTSNTSKAVMLHTQELSFAMSDKYSKDFECSSTCIYYSFINRLVKRLQSRIMMMKEDRVRLNDGNGCVQGRRGCVHGVLRELVPPGFVASLVQLRAPLRLCYYTVNFADVAWLSYHHTQILYSQNHLLSSAQKPCPELLRHVPWDCSMLRIQTVPHASDDEHELAIRVSDRVSKRDSDPRYDVASTLR